VGKSGDGRWGKIVIIVEKETQKSYSDIVLRVERKCRLSGLFTMRPLAFFARLRYDGSSSASLAGIGKGLVFFGGGGRYGVCLWCVRNVEVGTRTALGFGRYGKGFC